MVRSTQRIGVGHHVAWISHLNGGSSPVVPVVNGSGRLANLMVMAWTEYTRFVSAGRFTPCTQQAGATRPAAGWGSAQTHSRCYNPCLGVDPSRSATHTCLLHHHRRLILSIITGDNASCLFQEHSDDPWPRRTSRNHDVHYQWHHGRHIDANRWTHAGSLPHRLDVLWRTHHHDRIIDLDYAGQRFIQRYSVRHHFRTKQRRYHDIFWFSVATLLWQKTPGQHTRRRPNGRNHWRLIMRGSRSGSWESAVSL